MKNEILTRNVRKYLQSNPDQTPEKLSELFLVSVEEIQEIIQYISHTKTTIIESEASEKSVLSLKKQHNKNFLEDLALDKLTYEEALDAHAKNATIDKLKLFQLQLAKSEMLRVTRLLDTYSMVQDRYLAKLEEDSSYMDITELAEHSKAIFGFMQQSLSIIDKFTKDETLRLLILDQGIDKESENIRTAYTGEEIIADKFVRREVRASATRILNSLTAITNPDILDGEIIEENPTPTATKVKEVNEEKVSPKEVSPIKSSMSKEEFEKQLAQMPDDEPISSLFKKGEN